MRSAAVSQRSCRALALLLRALCTGPENPPTECLPAWVPQKLHIEFDNAFCLSSYLMVALSATISQVGLLELAVAWGHCLFAGMVRSMVKPRSATVVTSNACQLKTCRPFTASTTSRSIGKSNGLFHRRCAPTLSPT